VKEVILGASMPVEKPTGYGLAGNIQRGCQISSGSVSPS